jgi:hypothetical protein
VILRRLYIYLVSVVAVAVLAFGLSELGSTVLLFLFNFNSPYAESTRSLLAGYTAIVVVAFPVWAIHMWFGRRFALRDPDERGSAIRRLYVYLASTGFSIGAAIALADTFTNASRQQLDGCCYDEVGVTQSAWVTIVLLAMWAFHYRLAARDRSAVGERGASATIRRWYMYIALFVGLLMMLAGAQSVIQLAWVMTLNSSLYTYLSLAVPAGELAGGFVLWAFHARVLATRHIEDDRKSTLRAVEGFLAVAICIIAALFGASEILYYGLARALAVENPGGFGNDILAGLAQPASYMVVFGIAWFFIRRRLARDASSGEAARQAGMRRLYTNLVCLVSLAALATGAAGLLGTLLQLAEAPIIGVPVPEWKDPVSLWLTLLVVGTAVWLANWRPVPWLEERLALSRRIYVWAALLGSVLAVLGGAIDLMYVLFQQIFSTHPLLNDAANLAFGQSLAIIVVAAAVGIYHWRVMRSDAAARPATTHATREAVAAPVVIVPAAPADHSPALEVIPGQHFVLSVVGATEDDVHQALANLPPQASYKLIPSDHST